MKAFPPMRERLQEIWSSMMRNRLRTVLTGFAVAWGIFMLVVLLGAGNGLRHAVFANFGDQASNTLEIYGGRTSVPFRGYDENRAIRLRVRDADALAAGFPEITGAACSGQYAEKKLTAGPLWITAYPEGVTPAIAAIDGIKMLEGRFINRMDIESKRKVLVIDRIAADALFPGRSPVGERVEMDGISYTVTGLYDSPSYYNDSHCYLPFSTGRTLYAAGEDIAGRIVLTLGDVKGGPRGMEEIEDGVRARLGALHGFSPDDESAVWIYNSYRSYRTTMAVFGGITMFIWLIGIGTLTAGIVGVSNIMLVTVRERTAEFGIRKALGAAPRSITASILSEAVMITALFGYVGMAAGVGVMEAVGYYTEKATAGQEFAMFIDPTPDLSVAVSATAVLVAAGLAAGWIPARRAARLKTADALKYDRR